MTQQQDAALALLALAAENMYEAMPLALQPTPDPLVAANGWTTRGYLTAVDQVLRFDLSRVYYGFLAERAPGEFAVAVRGTERAVEWFLDSLFALIRHPIVGRCEDGFWRVYSSMHFRSLAGLESPLITGLLDAIGAGGTVTVVGHSLGSALGSFLAFDLAKPSGGPRVASRLFASPRPGDSVFAQAVAAAVPDSVAYVYAPDLVPLCPPAEFGYASLQSSIVLPKNAAIKDNPLSNHHVQNYAWLLNPAAVPGGPV